MDVYTENKRCICPVESKEFGTVLVIGVAATMVGSINFNDPCECKEAKTAGPCIDGKCMVGRQVRKFDEHGIPSFLPFHPSACLDDI